ncbi:transposase [Corynebacterium macginleyi]|uniref:Transposase n=1 Tax=Corynebacterium macginleyi TaxID=38290 RepID=A0A3M0GYZ2_9CORY|nr:transposase [Corynebacterium macginleyi]MBK4139801.1 transposase [Corynebacterium macginleyi]MBK4156391.1 transposase [Corynebacterium macginleyi]RMB62526.1 transposase [Corynebacterium macginleyi]
MPKNTYSDEFKADAVRLYETTEGSSYASISEDLGIARGTLKNWVHTARRDRGQIPSTSPAAVTRSHRPQQVAIVTVISPFQIPVLGIRRRRGPVIGQ